MTSNQVQVRLIDRVHSPLYPTGASSIRYISKALLDQALDSRQPAMPGEQPWPIDFNKAIELMPHNPHHETCIRTKRDSTLGLGFENEFDKTKRMGVLDPEGAVSQLSSMDPNEISRAEEVLSPLVDTTVQELLNDVGEDFENTGNGYIEVVRDQSGRIVSLWHLPACHVFVVVEKNSNVHRHYLYRGVQGGDKRFARFGDRDGMIARLGLSEAQAETVSEVIHFRATTARSKFYGIPNWLSAVPAIELMQMIHQQQFDFFLNRGVPEFMALFIGQKLDKGTWDKVEEGIRNTIGMGNQHKTMALNITDPDMRVQIEKLALEGKTENSFKELSESMTMEIVSAHRVPPLLAGVQIPGKLGAVNELPNALIAFQTLHVNQVQKMFQDTLANTLGMDLGLSRDDFTFRKITDQFNLQGLDTLSRMRETAAEAQQSRRDMEDGVKKDALPEEVGASLGRMLMAAQRVSKSA